MSNEQIELSLVIACYNEEGHLEDCVEQVIGTLDHTCWTYEIIFVEDCSTDNTRRVIARLVETYCDKNIRTLYHKTNTGRGRAVSDGIQMARGKIVGFIDIDLEVHARYMPAFALAIAAGADVATAERIYKLTPTIFIRAFLSRGYVRLVQLLLGLDLPDTEAGYKFFNRARLMEILPLVEDPGWFWDTEILALAALNRFRVETIPALYIRRPNKKSTVRLVRDTTVYLKNLWRFRRRLNLLRGHQKDPLDRRVR